MNGDCRSSNAAKSSDRGRMSHARRRRHLDREQARPLGPKAAALHARRQRLSLVKAAASAARSANAGEFILSTEDGVLAFSLRTSYAGLYVERTQRHPLGARLVQSMIFDGSEAFMRWCGADPVRFDDPLLFGRLRRQGDELIRAKP